MYSFPVVVAPEDQLKDALVKHADEAENIMKTKTWDEYLDVLELPQGSVGENKYDDLMEILVDEHYDTIIESI